MSKRDLMNPIVMKRSQWMQWVVLQKGCRRDRVPGSGTPGYMRRHFFQRYRLRRELASTVAAGAAVFRSVSSETLRRHDFECVVNKHGATSKERVLTVERTMGKNLVFTSCLVLMIANCLAAQADSGVSLVINEVMASNSKTKADPQGQFDDWIEIYNNGTRPSNWAACT